MFELHCLGCIKYLAGFFLLHCSLVFFLRIFGEDDEANCVWNGYGLGMEKR